MPQTFKKKLFYLFLFIFLNAVTLHAQQQSMKLWYDNPANASAIDSPNGWESDSEWLKALPVGNAFLGAMVFGDVNKERIQVNEKSLWSGSVDDNNNPDAATALPKIRALLFDGKYKEANELINKYMVCNGVGSGSGNGANVPYGCYQTLGDLRFDFHSNSPYSNYKRQLDLENAVVTISYTQNNVQFKREIFASYPDRALIIRLSANKKRTISFTSSLTRPERFLTRAEENQLLMTGTLTNGKGGDGIQYAARLQAKTTDGKVLYKDSMLSVENASEVTLIFTAATNYKLHYPDYKGDDPVAVAASQLQHASALSFTQLLARHEKDFASIF